VDRAADTPVFRQIYLQLRSAILSGKLRPGAKLPSTRELSVQLGVSRSAVVSAFEQLLAEGYASGRKGAGTFIAADLNLSRRLTAVTSSGQRLPNRQCRRLTLAVSSM
jgi:GntR family transcriptional regulator/MocR family aminotransferase